MDYTATNPMDAITQEELDALAPADQLARWKSSTPHFWCKEKVYLNLVSDIGQRPHRLCHAQQPVLLRPARLRLQFRLYRAGHDHPDRGVLPYAGYYTFDRIDVECQTFDTVAARSDALAAESLQNTVLGTNSLTGEITVSEPKVLVIQIPYSGGWSATVDGQPAELLRAKHRLFGPGAGAGQPYHRAALPHPRPCGGRLYHHRRACWRLPASPCFYRRRTP